MLLSRCVAKHSGKGRVTEKVSEQQGDLKSLQDDRNINKRLQTQRRRYHVFRVTQKCLIVFMRGI